MFIVAIPVYIFNLIFDTNYLFLNEASEGSPLVIVWDIFGTRLGGAGYLTGIVLMVLIIFHILYMLYKLLDIIRDKKGGYEMKAKKIEKKRQRPEICLSLNCATMEEIKEEIEKYKDFCQIVEWCADKTLETSMLTQGELTARIKEIKSMCPGKKIIVDYKGDTQTGNRIQKWAMGYADITMWMQKIQACHDL